MSKKEEKKVQWVSGKYPGDLTYTSLENVIKQLQEALEAQKRGEWRQLSLEVETEEYEYGGGSSHSIVLSGQRPETEAERIKREDWAKGQEAYRRKMYEQLKKEFGE